jgi:DNA polymerase-3 subunit delta'
VPGFDAIIDQDIPVRTLRSYLKTGAIPQALLFTGAEGVGKRTAALAFAMALNCGSGGERPCGSCTGCRKIAAGRHPDVHQLAPAGAMIRIEPVREFCRVLALRPYEAPMRVGVIAEAHALNPAAANALLKTLEEPPGETVLILTARQPEELLPTIVSRCQHLRFKPLARRHLAAILERAYGFEPREAEAAAEIAGGSVTQALALKAKRRLERRDWIASELSPRRPKPAAWALAMAERLARDPEETPADLELIALWLRDLAVARLDPDRIGRPDRREEILADAAGLPPDFPVQAYAALEEARRRIAARGNVRLTLEALLVKIKNLAAAATW